MPDNTDINDLVNEIWYPDVVENIDYDIDYNTDSRYQFMITHLCKHIKKCNNKGLDTPYIQIKDKHGKFVFNDRLTIKTSDHYTSSVSKVFHYYIDFVYDGNANKTVYCIIKSITDQDKKQTAFANIDFEKPIDQLYLEDYDVVVEAMVNQLEEQKKERLPIVDINLVTHCYNATAKQWDISTPVKEV